MIDRRGFFALALRAAAVGAVGAIAAPVVAQDATYAPNHRRQARSGAPKPQQEADAAQADGLSAPNHRRSRRTQAQASQPEVVADLEMDAQPKPFRATRPR